MNSLYLIATMAGEDIAIAADKVESVVKVRDIVPVPSVNSYVRGLFALRSRVLTVIDSSHFVTGKPGKVHDAHMAVVTQVAGHFYGLLVDSVQDVCTAESTESDLPANLRGMWREIGTAMLLVDGKTMLVVDPARFVEAEFTKAA
ncbi:chemotaxis protein CheW [Sphingorhabdus sp. Alg239-R122]|uniref:chemotaxis protein CheW n=1 Tax=Sphingorhabdus sp. Alg239-R122 TaxID=2305989 RepID=UPI0013DD67C7|nr:chemotaxis protein CheW [Sphingorhabdus sp. Alg239-R122]